MSFFKHGISIQFSIKTTRQDLTLLFSFSLSVLLVFSTFPITVSSFVFLVTADVKLICIYHLTFNICWDTPQLEQLTFCCRQNQNYIVCILCEWLVWLPFTNTQSFRFIVRQFCVLYWCSLPLILGPGFGFYWSVFQRGNVVGTVVVMKIRRGKVIEIKIRKWEITKTVSGPLKSCDM